MSDAGYRRATLITKKGVSWDTAIDGVTAGGIITGQEDECGVHPLGVLGIAPEITYEQDRRSTGSRVRRASRIETQNGAGPCPLYFPYDHSQVLLAIAAGFGAATTPALITTALAFESTFSIGETPSANFLTVAELVKTTTTFVQEWASNVVKSIEIKSAANQKVEVIVEFLGTRANLNDAGEGVNNPTSISGLIVPAQRIAIAGEGTFEFRINAQGGAGLATGDDQPITDFSFKLENNFNTFFPHNLSGNMAQPQDMKGFDATLNFTIPEFLDKTYYESFRDGTYWKVQLIWTHADIIEEAQPYTMDLNIPSFLVDGDPIDSEDAVAQAVSGFCEETVAGTNPTGMTDSKPYFHVINLISDAYL